MIAFMKDEPLSPFGSQGEYLIQDKKVSSDPYS